MRSRGQRAADAALCLFILVTTFLYRFNALGGAFGGFSNDDFGYLARARQIQAGDVPFRDFNDPGWFLTDGASALAQWAGGYNLRSQAVLTAAMLAIAAAVTFVLARRAAGSYLPALAATAIHIALEPRHYNYPKIVLYALGLWLSWSYIDRPSRPKTALLGALVGIGFLFRHDHLVYLGVLALLTLVVAHRHAIREALDAAMWVGASAAVFIIPFLGFLAVNGGVGEYFRSALVYVQRDADRTGFSFPTFGWDDSMPLAGIAPAGDTAALINIRWNAIDDVQRQRLETQYGLEEGTTEDGTTWAYRLGDVTPANIESMVRDPRIEDTHGIDRARFEVVRDTSVQLRTQFDTVQNATAVLYYLFLTLPLIAAVVLARLHSAAAPPGPAMTSVPHLLPLLVVAGMLAIGFLSRGSTNIRIPDVGVTSAVLLAWLIAVIFGRDAIRLAVRPMARIGLRVVATALLVVTVLSVNGLAHPVQTLRDDGFTSGPAAVAQRTGTVWRTLGVAPPVFAQDGEQPELLKVASYLHRCIGEEDRLFVLGHYPELYYFADRRFAGGHAWLLPEYYSDTVDEMQIVDRLRAASVPIVVTEDRATYENEYRPVFELVDAYLRDNYVEAGEIDLGAMAIRVLARRDAAATRDEQLGLPCAASAASQTP